MKARQCGNHNWEEVWISLRWGHHMTGQAQDGQRGNACDWLHTHTEAMGGYGEGERGEEQRHP